ncbi:MAG: leucine-rich repeat domain-containing protein [Candidatus Pacebacteria bacterium]|nr:leucine-rich repeat domain-containing protein [Candidatus Paceibacterota bacterium]
MKKFLFIIITTTLLLSGCSLSQEILQTNRVEENKSLSNKVTTDNVPKTGNQKKEYRLDLSNQGLKKIPEYVFGLTNLEELYVSNNELTGAIQAEVRHLKNLKILDASNNQMTGVPAEVGQLNYLEVLNLSNNQLTGLPYELGNLQNLKTFNISGNNYSESDLGIITNKLPENVEIIK